MSNYDNQELVTHGQTSRSSFFFPFIILILLLGFSLRLYDLDGQSMWSDEGLTFYRAGLPLREILQNVIVIDGVDTQDTNPPLYFLLLHIWRAMTGETVFTMRLGGVIPGLLSVPLLYVIGAVTFGRRAGLIAALFLAISPFHIWQSQVLRNYGLLIFFNLLSVYGLFRYILTPTGQGQFRWPSHLSWLALWLVTGLLGIYTHYFGFFILAFGFLSLIISEIRKHRNSPLVRKRRIWIIIIAGLLLLLPASYIAVTRFFAGQQFDFFFVPVLTIIYRAASAFAVGMDRTLVHPWWRVLPVTLLALIGLYFGWRVRRPATILVFGYLVFPLGFLLTLSYINPLYNGTRHLLIGLPPFILLVSNGIVGPIRRFSKADKSGAQQLWRWAAPLLGLLIVVSQLLWVREQFNSPRLIRDDVRGAVEVLNTLAQPNDLIVLHDTLIRPTFDYYYKGEAPAISIPRLDEWDVNSAIKRLEELPAPGQLIWILTKPTPRTGIDPQALVDWAEENWRQLFKQDFPHMWLQVSLSAYLPYPEVDSLPDKTNSIDATWINDLQILSAAYPSEAISGQAWWPTFFVTPISTEPEKNTFVLRFVGSDGTEWARINDMMNAGRPFIVDGTDSIMRYIHRTQLPLGISSGEYQIWMQLVRSDSGEIIPLTNGDTEIQLPDVTITSASCDTDLSKEPGSVTKNIRINQDLELLGYRWRAGEYRPGNPIPVDLWWCAKQSPKADYRWRLQLVDEGDRLIGDSFGLLFHQEYPPTQWQPDEIIKSTAQIIVPAVTEAGSYELQLSLVKPDRDEAVKSAWSIWRESYPLGTVDIEPWPMMTDLPGVDNLMPANFGNPPLIELHGYDLSTNVASAGDIVDLDIAWRSLTSEIQVSYTIFVHLVDNDERIIAQVDAIPMGGTRPTTSWRQDEVILDHHLISIPQDGPPGTYNLWIGFYEAATGLRLPISVDGQQQPGDRLLLQEFVVAD